MGITEEKTLQYIHAGPQAALLLVPYSPADLVVLEDPVAFLTSPMGISKTDPRFMEQAYAIYSAILYTLKKPSCVSRS